MHYALTWPLETAYKSGQVLTEKVIARASLVYLPDSRLTNER